MLLFLRILYSINDWKFEFNKFILSKYLFLSNIFIAFAFVCSTKPPKWEPVYTAKGEIHIPYAGINEPFFAWYEAKTGRSRIDYYGDTCKTYQFSRENGYGSSYKIVPVTNEVVTNKATCMVVNGTTDNPISIQTVLPDVSNFSLIGELNYLYIGINYYNWTKWILLSKFIY